MRMGDGIVITTTRSACYHRPVEGRLDLLDRWRDGDKAAGQALFARHFDRYSASSVQSRSRRDDLVQRTLLACARRRTASARIGFRTYLFTVRARGYSRLRARRATAAVRLLDHVGRQILTTGDPEDQDAQAGACRALRRRRRAADVLELFLGGAESSRQEVFEIDSPVHPGRPHRAREAARVARATGDRTTPGLENTSQHGIEARR